MCKKVFKLLALEEAILRLIAHATKYNVETRSIWWGKSSPSVTDLRERNRVKEEGGRRGRYK